MVKGIFETAIPAPPSLDSLGQKGGKEEFQMGESKK
jgi:hypothetical protein